MPASAWKARPAETCQMAPTFLHGHAGAPMGSQQPKSRLMEHRTRTAALMSGEAGQSSTNLELRETTRSIWISPLQTRTTNRMVAQGFSNKFLCRCSDVLGLAPAPWTLATAPAKKRQACQWVGALGSMLVALAMAVGPNHRAVGRHAVVATDHRSFWLTMPRSGPW